MRKERPGVFLQQGKEPVVERIAQLARQHPSRSAAARAWGININTLNSYFKKDSAPATPRENLLSRIAECEGVSLEWLVNGGDEHESLKARKTTSTTSSREELFRMLSVLDEDECQQLVAFFTRKGMETLLYLLDEDNIKLMQLDAIVKEKILGKQSNAAREAAQNAERARECDPDSQEIGGSARLDSGKRKAQ